MDWMELKKRSKIFFKFKSIYFLKRFYEAEEFPIYFEVTIPSLLYQRFNFAS